MKETAKLIIKIGAISKKKRGDWSEKCAHRAMRGEPGQGRKIRLREERGFEWLSKKKYKERIYQKKNHNAFIEIQPIFSSTNKQKGNAEEKSEKNC